MLRDDAIALIKERLQQGLAGTELDTKILTEMKAAQADVLEQDLILPWFLLTENLTFTLTAGEERIPMPEQVGAYMLKEHDEGALWLQQDDGSYLPLDKDTYEIIAALYPNPSDGSGRGKPKAYSLEGRYFRVRPVPDTTYVVKIKVYTKDTVLASNIENKWLFWAADLLMAVTGERVAKYHLRDGGLAAVFADDKTIARARLGLVDQARKDENRNYTMGDE